MDPANLTTPDAGASAALYSELHGVPDDELPPIFLERRIAIRKAYAAIRNCDIDGLAEAIATATRAGSIAVSRLRKASEASV
jgi:hypothetical protein